MSSKERSHQFQQITSVHAANAHVHVILELPKLGLVRQKGQLTELLVPGAAERLEKHVSPLPGHRCCSALTRTSHPYPDTGVVQS